MHKKQNKLKNKKKTLDLKGISLTFQAKSFLKRFKNAFNTGSPVNNEELTEYINKIFEQQEKDRIVRWLVNSIRETLELDKVLETIVREIGKLLNVDKCLIALYEKEEQKLFFRSEYRKEEKNFSLINVEKRECRIPERWQNLLIKGFSPILVNNTEKDKLNPEIKKYLKENGIKSLIITPIVHKEEFLGILTVHQIEYPRKWEESHLEVLKDTGGQIAIAINQAILYSKIQETTRLKNEFLAGMSHELRTPLNAIMGFSEMLLSENQGKLNEKQKKFLNNIFISGEHLLRLVNDILDLSKIESGNMTVNYEKFNANVAIHEAVSVLRGFAVKKNVSIEMEIDTELHLNADMRMFKQIMYNLLSNAVKFSEDNETVTVRAFKENGHYKFEVCDNGIGILPKDRDKIFKSFRQLDSSLTRKQEGTGLGLTLTKKLIELHNGVIDFESERNKGSKFWFTLPAYKADTSLDCDSDLAYNA